MSRVLSKPFEHLLVRSSEDVMNFVSLVELVVAREQRVQGYDFEHHTPHSPNVHFPVVVAVGEETFRCSIPPCRNVFGVRVLRVNSFTTPEISQLNVIAHHEDILRLDVPVEYSVGMHVIQCLEQLKHVRFDFLRLQIYFSSFNVLIKVVVHQLKNQGQSASGLVVEHLNEFDNMVVRR